MSDPAWYDTNLLYIVIWAGTFVPLVVIGILFCCLINNDAIICYAVPSEPTRPAVQSAVIEVQARSS